MGREARGGPPDSAGTCRAARAALRCERRKHLPGDPEDGEVPVAGMELKLAARYRGGEQPGVPGRDRSVGIAVVDRCRHGDGPELEAPGLQEHPQVLGNSPAAAAERLCVAGQECLAQAGPGERAAVDGRQLAGGQAEKQPRAAHAAANGPPAETPSSAAGPAASSSSTSAASSVQSASRRRPRGSVPPMPGRSGVTRHNPSSSAAGANSRADSRESASPWQKRTGVPPCSPITSTAITLPSPRLTSIPHGPAFRPLFIRRPCPERIGARQHAHIAEVPPPRPAAEQRAAGPLSRQQSQNVMRTACPLQIRRQP